VVESVTKMIGGETSVFIGEYEHSVDAKGRVIMPAKLREDIGEKFILTKGLDGCLFAYSQTEWQNFEEKLKTLPLTNKNARDFVRFFLSGAIECEIDKQGRFLIPGNLREYGKLDKEIVILGVGTRIEIWDKNIWKNDSENISADEIAENMDTYLGI
jgi:MraZ protein